MEFANQIRLATGLTMPEAARMGLLPFQVVARRHPTDALTAEDYARAMIAEGASVLEEPSNPILRFESLEEAETSQDRLERLLTGSRWTIIQHDASME